MKDPLYNGICLTIIGKDGNKPNIPIAVAYIHKETVDNFACFFLQLLHLKFCTVHIRFNVMDKFKSLKLNLQSVKNDILALQVTFVVYIPQIGALPLFGIRTTSAIEEENNGLLWGRVRNQLVLGSLMAYSGRL
ncbi:uncharacterized protein PITG_01149 [Phytophthora infestans T30-4]|uniref:MULE transposase domain-containing protein n=1 Tax=Phytophthora infestans (strain T30-4) TaxID=403677 RepID=D0MSL1_PHYIT|nr:uncharacterized protein PITG_01149 [Phytophthora infestans T30-4]EEY58480.1 conserved hypothetical protein [Phytophthora infestans T30-4]|eukprot:XP_002909666.1 conserved hypothetical protein [Phytophthora infestans T30-4]